MYGKYDPLVQLRKHVLINSNGHSEHSLTLLCGDDKIWQLIIQGFLSATETCLLFYLERFRKYPEIDLSSLVLLLLLLLVQVNIIFFF